MSLDIYLQGEERESACTCPCCGNEHSHKSREEFFSANITHNLNSMANAAGVYECLWGAEENGFKKAGQLVEPLKAAIADMEARPQFYETFNASNGWGTFEDFLPWLKRLLDACISHPSATIEISK